MLLDNSINEQSYIEDCEFCCNSIQISLHFFDSELLGFQVDSIE
ncbi:CPXCG motif-containing cysteine-rich protein [Flavivirga aquatica]